MLGSVGIFSFFNGFLGYGADNFFIRTSSLIDFLRGLRNDRIKMSANSDHRRDDAPSDNDMSVNEI